ncbi:MAG TPA: IclR family transcriptional regulator [Bryobacteraceae bacterium]|nr:IclR family transcriptional regulator [Bryobacteraceae bacterium]
MAAKEQKTVRQPAEKYMVPVVRSTFRILEELSGAGALGLNEVTQRTKIPKSTVFRVLATLHSLGYVIRDDNRDYCVSPTLMDLAGDQGNAEVLRRAALPWMVKLRNESGETVNLGQLQFDKVVYLEVVPSEFALRLSERPGATVAAHASSLGKAILAFSPPGVLDGLLRAHELTTYTRNTIAEPAVLTEELRRVRDRGYALDRGEISSLATCVGAPIVAENGCAIAAMSISGPTSRFNPRRDSPIIESLVRATREISSTLRRRTTVLSTGPEKPRQ